MLDKNEYAESGPPDFSTRGEEQIDPESCNHETQSRLRAVLLYEKGHSVDEVVAETGFSRSSLLSWYRAYKLYGLKGLFDRREGGNNAKLTEHQIQELIERLRDRTPRDFLGHRAATIGGQVWTVEDLYNIIWQWYGVRYKSRTSYYNLLKRCVPNDWQSE